jgi:transcriptional regulator with XRE-family HTH domain
MTHRLKEARQRAGLSVGQAAVLLSMSSETLLVVEKLHDLPDTALLLQLADLYRVSACWLSGHNPQPDLSALAAKAKAMLLPDSDWHEIKLLAESMAWCQVCCGQAVTCHRCGIVAERQRMTKAAGVFWCHNRTIAACLIRAAKRRRSEGEGG